MTDNETRAREICSNLCDPETDIKTIATALDAAVEAERFRCEDAAAKAPTSELLPMFEPTPENKHIWEIAINAGVLNAVQAIRAIRTTTKTGGEDG